MSEPYAPTPTPDNPSATATRRWSGFAIAAMVLAVGLTVVLLSVKTLGAAWAYPGNSGDYDTPALALGTLLAVGIVPDLLTVVFGHIALVQTRDGERGGRVIAAIALGVGYLHVLLWGNRLINAAVAAVAGGDLSQLVPNLFWWA